MPLRRGRGAAGLDGAPWRRRHFKPPRWALALVTCTRTSHGINAASLTIAAGADVLAVQRLLGHPAALSRCPHTPTFRTQARTPWRPTRKHH